MSSNTCCCALVASAGASSTVLSVQGKYQQALQAGLDSQAQKDAAFGLVSLAGWCMQHTKLRPVWLRAPAAACCHHSVLAAMPAMTQAGHTHISSAQSCPGASTVMRHSVYLHRVELAPAVQPPVGCWAEPPAAPMGAQPVRDYAVSMPMYCMPCLTVGHASLTAAATLCGSMACMCVSLVCDVCAICV